MQELLECFQRWLDANRADGRAYELLLALTKETLKFAESADGSQREFDAVQLAAAAQWEDDQRRVIDDIETAKRRTQKSGWKEFFEARRRSIESFFRQAGNKKCLRPVCRSPGGRHRAVWYLEIYDLPDEREQDEVSPIPDRPDTNGADQRVDYEYTPPGLVKPAWYVRPLVGAGSVLTWSPRGVIWLAVILFLLAFLILTTFVLLTFNFVRRPVQTSDLAGFATLASICWLTWSIFLRPISWLLEDRIIPATELWVAWREENAQLELIEDPNGKRRIQLVRYSAVCPVCGGYLELGYSNGADKRRLVGQCREAPHDHVFTFDRVRRSGRRLES